MKRNTTLALLVVAGLALAGCGGGSSPAEAPAPSPAPATGDVPAEASASPAGFVGWMGKQAKDDTKEPLNVQGFVPPTSETDEPVALD